MIVLHLITESEPKLETFLIGSEKKTFYHYFPLIYAASVNESAYIDDCGRVWSAPDELYYDHPEIPNKVNYIWVSTRSNIPGFTSKIYDNNYVYDVKTTLGIKNFRMNLKKFRKETEGLEVKWIDNPPIEDMINLLKEWYQDREGEQSDMGYTVQLIYQNRDTFKSYSLVYRGLYIGTKLMNISIYGKLDQDTAIFIVCKSLKLIDETIIYFIGDYVRSLVYNEILNSGMHLVNDGSDLGHEGLVKYKMKFRPIEVFNIYSHQRC